MQPLEKVELTISDKLNATNSGTNSFILASILAIMFFLIAFFLVEGHYIIRIFVIAFFTIIVTAFGANKSRIDKDLKAGIKLIGKMRINKKYISSSSEESDKLYIQLVDAEERFDLGVEILSSEIYNKIKIHDQVDIEFLEKSKHILSLNYKGNFLV